MSQALTPTTAALLDLWFDPKQAGWLYEAQRQTIQQAICAREQLVASVPRSRWTQHRVVLPIGASQIPMLMALLVWQLLNRNDAHAAGMDDPRFTSRFVVLAPDLITRGGLYNALCGRPRAGGRDFDTADIVRHADRLIPAERRDEVLSLVRSSVCSGAQVSRTAVGDSVIAIAGDRWEALECIARLPNAMLFEEGPRTLHPHGAHALGAAQATTAEWR